MSRLEMRRAWTWLLLLGNSLICGGFEFPGTASYSDGHIDPKFVVSMSSTLATQLSGDEVNGRVVPMTDRAGNRYICVLPTESEVESQIEQLHRGSSALSDMPPDGGTGLDDLSDILMQLSGSCLYRLEGWWSYEYCHRKHLRQFHREPQAKEDSVSYTLGRFTDQTITVPAPSENPAVARILEQGLTEGSDCDITGGPRVATVRFMCNHLGTTHSLLAEVKEVATCQYQATVMTNLLCQHEAFAPKTGVVNQLVCYPVDPITSGNEDERESAPAGLAESAEARAGAEGTRQPLTRTTWASSAARPAEAETEAEAGADTEPDPLPYELEGREDEEGDVETEGGESGDPEGMEEEGLDGEEWGGPEEGAPERNEL